MGLQNSQGNGQIEIVPLFANVGRRQVDHHHPGWQVEAAVLDRRAYPLLALTHGGVGETDHVHLG
jgi:hypothetical protein